MRNDHPPPWLYSSCQEMTDEEVEAVLDFLYELTNAFENRYFDQLHRIARKEKTKMRRSRNEP